MKAEKIKKLLKGVMDNLIKSISDEEIKDIIKNYSFIAGGCIPSMLLDEYINDFDIYLVNKNSVDKVLEYYKKNYNEAEGKLLKDNKKFEPKLITANSINLTDKVQIVTKFYGEPANVVNKFDWQHIKSWYEYPDVLCLNNDIYKLIVEKDLIYTGSNYPLSSLFRTRKFIKRGWSVDDKTMLKIVLDICDILIKTSRLINEDDGQVITHNPEYSGNVKQQVSVDELIDQLNGVDPLIMQNIIEDKTGEFLSVSEIIERL